MTVDLWSLTIGSQVELDEGVIAEIQAPTEDGQWVKVKYVRAPQHPELVGTEDLCSAHEITRVESNREPHVH
jgi:RNA-binding protein YhbY